MHPPHSRTDSNRPGTPQPPSAARAAEAAREEFSAARKPNAEEQGSKLIVGPNIQLKGAEITDCAILVVEGRVEASMNSRDMRIAEGGVFTGKAEIDVAEVRGTFEGELTAHKRLVIYSTGKVNGTIRYGALMVEEGGVISGNTATHDACDLAHKLPPAGAQVGAGASTAMNDADVSRPPGDSAQVRSLPGKRQP
jgi:cytoskeletal protein CcmA (bactofilin family)